MKGRRTNGIGLAIVGAGRVGLFRGEVAARHPAVEWIGIAELNDNRGKSVAAKIVANSALPQLLNLAAKRISFRSTSPTDLLSKSCSPKPT